jgi:hypothetical protein
MDTYDWNRSHLGNCKYCPKRVYWVWDKRGFWAPPFETWVDGHAIRPTFMKHHCG